MRKRDASAVPRFSNQAEEIEFWDTHDVEDYLTGEEELLDVALAPR